MYGYFLKRIDQRFQLEKTMKILPGGSSDIETIDQSSGNEIGTLGNISPKSPTPNHRSYISGRPSVLEVPLKASPLVCGIIKATTLSLPGFLQLKRSKGCRHH
ncbi:hypothetical protein Leryth_001963 [Lithospermum erythrorhizon]|nr:hypothetical protein Leryth_001963 [Lithospermum erythrorhizon]